VAILLKNKLQFSKRGRHRVIRLKIPATLPYRDLAVRMVAASCKLVSAKKIDRATGHARPDLEFDDQVVSAFGEAFNNVVLHGYDDSRGDVEIEVEPLHDRLVIRVMDSGKCFDLSQVPDPDLDALPEGGLGVFIMRSFMDEVTYTAGSPNVLSMTKLLVHDDETLADDVAGK
jgi:serine/threonine-protein kinase RsbW